ncbi:MAG: septum site-determining protein MinD, partial [Rhizobiales bacterium]|nr:septum site-determining protein MinD [Hyphomicrobiales bacterium]
TLKAERGEHLAQHLLLTRHVAARAERGQMLKVEDVLEILSIPLLGIIHESEAVLNASNVGCPLTLVDADSAPARAYIDAARRLEGENIPMVVPAERRGFMSKLFGRRAA